MLIAVLAVAVIVQNFDGHDLDVVASPPCWSREAIMCVSRWMREQCSSREYSTVRKTQKISASLISG